MRFSGIQSILSALVFRMNPLLLGIFLSTLFSMVEPCRVLVRMYYFVCVIRDSRESANNIIKSFVFRLFQEKMHCNHFLFELIMIKKTIVCV